jgi:hypothetical protein
MSGDSSSRQPTSGKVVTADTLTVAGTVLGQPLAEPWRRLAGMLVDLVVLGLLSLLAKPFLGIATGVLLFVLLGNSAHAPAGLKVFRWICRGAGVVVAGLSALALGHLSSPTSGSLHLDALATAGESSAMVLDVPIPPNAGDAELRAANRQLSGQVAALKMENKNLRQTGRSWVGQTRALVESMGVTFGWAGIYFTLVTGLTNGRSLGKFAVRTRVLKVNGTPLKFFDAFIRQGGYVAGVAMGMIGFLKLLWEPNRQAVEDRIASTVVVKI